MKTTACFRKVMQKYACRYSFATLARKKIKKRYSDAGFLLSGGIIDLHM
jgi:hypothetical protein